MAWLLRDGEVLAPRRNRSGLPRLRARCVIEAEAGAFARWGLRGGDRLDIRR
jgi:uncharacterized protein